MGRGGNVQAFCDSGEQLRPGLGSLSRSCEIECVRVLFSPALWEDFLR